MSFTHWYDYAGVALFLIGTTVLLVRLVVVLARRSANTRPALRPAQTSSTRSIHPHLQARQPVEHVDVDGDPTFSHKAAIAATRTPEAEAAAELDAARREEAAMLAELEPLILECDAALLAALHDFRVATRDAMRKAYRWHEWDREHCRHDDCDPSATLRRWRIDTPTGGWPTVELAVIQ